jgi:protein-S-isoprenylcysteine O-methyltransferase Ste14
MEETTSLINSGLYRYIRHPLYLSLILGGFGIMMKDPGWTQILLAGGNFIALYVTARVEEGEMIGKFGKEYTDYMKDTKMFIPFVI